MSENHDYHNQGGLIAFIGSMVFVFCFFFYIVFINKGVTLDENVSDPAPAGAVKFDLASVKEPWLENPEVALAGQKIYKQNCALCHGGNGDLVGGLPNARNLVEGAWKSGGGLINHYKVLQNGMPGTQMASFKQTLQPHERWAVLNYIETITNNKSKDTPEDVAAFAATAD
ncbi:c-type cytochrome [Pseudobdellovibrio exovorus]|uniref:Cytochrome c domain-containing protein n=1 Tax=Pseudobdellovibrio exovorus JSS TaxID=1184267 RepID=M4V9G1_9BACT|nr:cytochrome c [Pseudobdellovibrio exovorus]AGH94666.1 hypothetical protein A11Q_446 [Pseudobdellovibrio exovorus JSS]